MSHFQQARERGPAPASRWVGAGTAGLPTPRRARVSGFTRHGWPWRWGSRQQTRSFLGQEAPTTVPNQAWYTDHASPPRNWTPKEIGVSSSSKANLNLQGLADVLKVLWKKQKILSTFESLFSWKELHIPQPSQLPALLRQLNICFVGYVSINDNKSYNLKNTDIFTTVPMHIMCKSVCICVY